MRNVLIAIAMVVATPAPVGASDRTDVMEVVHRWTDAFNQGRFNADIAPCTEDAVVIDDFQPHVWQGPGACSRWFRAFAAWVSKTSVTNAVIRLGAIRHLDFDAGAKPFALEAMLVKLTAINAMTASLVFALCCSAACARAQPSATHPGHYLLVWAGDRAHKGNDFLAVIDADPSSASYGHLLTTLATDQQTVRVHHTEYIMPASGMLFANDHDAGRTFIFDVRNPLEPKIVTSFMDLGGYMHPHSYVRLPNGHVLVTFQHEHHGGVSTAGGKSGGLVEIDDSGRLIRSVSNADPAFAAALLMPYGLIVLPGIDRVVSTNSSMHDPDIFSGVTYQIWRLSDLKLLKTANFDVGPDHYAHISPEEPRLGPDGSVFVQTLGCGLERITGIDTAEAQSKLVHVFPGNWCGVPTIVGHFLVQSVPAVHGFVVLDIADAAKPVEVSRLTLSDRYFSHWTGWDPKTERLVVTASATPDDRTYLLKFDQTRGVLTVDTAFRDIDGEPGFSFSERDWPHGWRGVGIPHGAVFTR